MNKIKNIILTLVFMSCPAFADTAETDSFNVSDGFLSAGDLVLVRPISSAVTIASFGVFAIVAPFTEMAGCTEETYNGLVESPGKFSFNRDLGKFNK